MKCEKIRELLSPYLDGMTNEKETHLVKEHLQSCSDCRNQLEQLRRVCKMMHELPVPDMPGNLYQDIEARLNNNNFKYFGRKLIKIPKKKGWIAAGAAALALAAGIYTSTLLPVSNLAVNLKDRFEHKKKEPAIAVNDILKRLGVSQNSSETSPQPESQEADQDNNTVLPIKKQFKTGFGQIKVADQTDINASLAADKSDTAVQADAETLSSAEFMSEALVLSDPGAESYSAEVVTSKILVDDIDSSVQQVLDIAAANKCQYEVSPDSNSVSKDVPESRIKMSVKVDEDNADMSLGQFNSEVKGLSIKVDEDRSDKVLDQLNSVGKTDSPVYCNLELTGQYNEVIKNINYFQQQIDKINSQEDVSEADQTRLDELQGELQHWSDIKLQLDERIQKVTINVYLIEDLQP